MQDGVSTNDLIEDFGYKPDGISEFITWYIEFYKNPSRRNKTVPNYKTSYSEKQIPKQPFLQIIV